MRERDVHSSPPEDAGEDRLIFRWDRKFRRAATRLGLFLIVSLVAHASAFYLFQVGYSATERIEPMPASVTLLNPEDPNTQALFREIGDRLIFLRPVSAGATERVDLTAATQFRPSFQDREMPFRKPVNTQEEPQATRTYTVNVLPDLETLVPIEAPAIQVESPPITTPQPEPGEPRWKLSGSLEGRELKAEKHLAEALPALSTAPALEFSVGIAPGGKIAYILPLRPENHPDVEPMMDALRNHLIFAPRPGADVQWGEIRIVR